MIEATLNGTDMPQIEQDFIDTPLEMAADIVTLDNSLYTDFTGGVARQWTFNYASLTKDQYDALRAQYDLQFTEYGYPLLSIPFYSLADMPCRMTINEKNIWDNCGDVQNVVINFREQYTAGNAPEDLLLEDDESLLMETDEHLVL